MQIQTLTLKTRHLAAQRKFYADLFGFQLVAEDAEQLTLWAGTSRLTFRQDSEFAGFYHVAFDIPRHQVDAAQSCLKARVPLLADSNGATRFLLTPRWNTTNLYFDDPAGNILEFIARHELPHDAAAEFSAASVVHLSELGLVVPDVPAAVRELGKQYGLHPFNGQSDTFTAVGGHDGMLIVVKDGRGWYPIGRPAVAAPFELTFEGSSGEPSGTIAT